MLATVLQPWVLVLLVGGPIAILVLTRLIIPSRGSYLTPSRIYLPILGVYELISFLVVQPTTLPRQVATLVVIMVAFWLGDRFARLVFTDSRAPATPPDHGPTVTIRARYLVAFEIVGVLLLAGIFAQHGVPVLSSDVSAVRVELAETATLFILGVAASQVALAMNLLFIAGRVRLLDSRRRPWVHVAFLTLVLGATSGRANVILPFVLAGICIVLRGRGARVPFLIAALVAAGFFTAVGLYRGSGADENRLLGPATAYLTATARTTDRIIKAEDEHVWEPHGSGVLWIPERLLGEKVKPPGLAVRETFGLKFAAAGFGAAMGINGAVWYDSGPAGAPFVGLLFGFLAGGFFTVWRRRGGWWGIAYAYVLLWLLLAVTQHPFANYWYIFFPVTLACFGYLNRMAVAHDARLAGPRPLSASGQGAPTSSP